MCRTRGLPSRSATTPHHSGLTPRLAVLILIVLDEEADFCQHLEIPLDGVFADLEFLGQLLQRDALPPGLERLQQLPLPQDLLAPCHRMAPMSVETAAQGADDRLSRAFFEPLRPLRPRLSGGSRSISIAAELARPVMICSLAKPSWRFSTSRRRACSPPWATGSSRSASSHVTARGKRGDCHGWPVEFLSLDTIRAKYVFAVTVVTVVSGASTSHRPSRCVLKYRRCSRVPALPPVPVVPWAVTPVTPVTPVTRDTTPQRR